MKKIYEAPEMEINKFQAEEVMTNGSGGIVLPDDDWE